MSVFYRDIDVNITDYKSELSKPLIVYERDRGLEIYFNLIRYAYRFDKNPSNLLENLVGAYATVTLVNPSGYEIGINEVEITEDAKVKFVITEDLTDELTEIGTYQLQIHINNDVEGRDTSVFSIPPFNFEVVERLKGIKNELLDSEGNGLTDNEGYQLVSASTNRVINFSADKINEYLNSIPTMQGEIRDINSQLNTITNKAKVVLTPEMFGARGDGITDDYSALWNLFNYRDDVDILFPKDKIYRVSRGIGIEKQGLTVYGNNSTIKFTDGSTILQEIYNGTSTTYKATLLYFNNYDNMAFYNLHLDGNADNVTFTHNGEIYRGYQQDIGIEGMPNKYICTYGFQGNGCNNVILENCSVKHIGAPINLGGVWGSNDIKKNIVIKNVEVEDCFRDGIVVCDCEDFVIENAKVTNSQRKGIQCYRNAHNGRIINPEIINNENEIRRWYPTWSSSNSDAELAGIAVQNPGYTDVCTNIEIINPYIDVYKIGLTIRNYSKNITVNRGYINSRNASAINHSGVIDLILRDLTLIGLTCIENDYSDTHNNVTNSSSTAIIENVILQGNLGIYYKIYDNCSLENINVLANNLTFSVTTKLNVVNTTKSNILTITSNSLSNQIMNGTKVINPYELLNIKNTYTTKLSYKSNTNKEYIKFFTFKINEINQCMLIIGTVNKLSGNNVVGFDFKVMIRSHWETLSSGIVTEIQFLNPISAQNTGIGYLTSYDEASNSINVDFYFVNSVKGNFMIDFQINDYEDSFDYEFIAKNSEWTTGLSMTKESLIS